MKKPYTLREVLSVTDEHGEASSSAQAKSPTSRKGREKWGTPAQCIVLERGRRKSSWTICRIPGYRRLPFLSTGRSRDLFLSILEQTRQRYRFVVVGYVVMPEHIHLLLTEPEVGTPSTGDARVEAAHGPRFVAQAQTEEPAPRNLFGNEPQHRAFWQARFFDFNVWRLQRMDDEEARGETQVYASQHGSQPSKARTGGTPEQWRWSSYRFYLLEEFGLVESA